MKFVLAVPPKGTPRREAAYVRLLKLTKKYSTVAVAWNVLLLIEAIGTVPGPGTPTPLLSVLGAALFGFGLGVVGVLLSELGDDIHPTPFVTPGAVVALAVFCGYVAMSASVMSVMQLWAFLVQQPLGTSDCLVWLVTIMGLATFPAMAYLAHPVDQSPE